MVEVAIPSPISEAWTNVSDSRDPGGRINQRIGTTPGSYPISHQVMPIIDDGRCVAQPFMHAKAEESCP